MPSPSLASAAGVAEESAAQWNPLALALALINPVILTCVLVGCLLTATFWGHGIIAGALLCVPVNLVLLRRLRHGRHLARSNVVFAVVIAATAGLVLGQSRLEVDLMRPETLLLLLCLSAGAGIVRALAIGLPAIWRDRHPQRLANRLAGTLSLLVVTASGGLQSGIAAVAAYGLGNDGFTNSRILAWLAERTPFVLDERRFASLLMRDEYLWRDRVDAAKAAGAKDAGEVVERLMHDAPDQWSGVIPLAEARELDQGLERNYGFIEAQDGQEQLAVAYVVPGSSASAAGLARGRRIFSRDGEAVTRANRGRLLGSAEQGRLAIAVSDADSNVRPVELYRGLIRDPAVLPPTVVEHDGKRVGYLFVRTFDTPFDLELRPALVRLKAEKIDELVLDLRYNGGGYEEDAVRLGSAIGGQAVVGKVALYESMNSRYAHLRHAVLFDADPDIALDLKRLTVIAGRSTCSASEAVIAMLRPYLDVKVVGGTTCGKPYSMMVRNYLNQSFTVITFALSNADRWGDYSSGIKPDCAVRDDLEHELGDPGEGRLKTALALLALDAQSARTRCPA